MDKQIAGELAEIDKRLREYYRSEANANDVSLASFSTDVRKLARDHSFLAEVLAYAETGKSPDLLPVPDLTSVFSKLQRGMTLEIPELLGLRALIVASEDCWDKFAKLDTFPNLRETALDIEDMPDLLRVLDMSFAPDGSVLDTASGTLMGIRRELRDLTAREGAVIARIRNKYKDSLELPEPVLRNGTQTLAVKGSFKASVPGITVDRSNTGQTLFVIPYELLEYENRKEKLKGDELAEIDRIVTALSKAFAARLPEAERNYYSYNLLDNYVAKAAFGSSYDGSLAQISNGALVLHGLIHPLIDPAKAVPNDVILGGDTPRIAIISGPNAGGKSVLLKALALAAYMNQMGLLVPARGTCSLPVFDNVFVLTGDSESLSGNLSSFSGHLKGLKEMYAAATGQSFVLVDEIGQGTSPEDGEAIGYAFIKHMAGLGSFGIFTTHYDGIKKLAMADNGILSGAMEFSRENLRPTFRFLAGAVGNSYAFEVARQNGLPDELIESAMAFKASQHKFDVEKLEEQLSLKIQKANELQKNLDSKLAFANELIRKRESEIKALGDEKDKIRKGTQAKIQEAAESRIEALDSLWKQGASKTLPFNERSRIKGALRKAGGIEENADKSTADITDRIKPGDTVVYENMVGKVESVGTKKARFAYNNLSFTVPLKDLRKSDTEYLPAPVQHSSNVDQILMNRAAKGSSRLNVIGLTVADALPEVDKFLDDAILARLSQVTIVHGMGTFALRNGIWDHLKRIKYVKSFREGGEGEGALGATVVILR